MVPFDFPEQYGLGPLPITPYWIASGIAFFSLTYNRDIGDSEVAVRLYEPDAALIVETQITGALLDDYGYPTGLMLVTHKGRDYVAHRPHGDWRLYDLLNQQEFAFVEPPPYPEQVSSTHPDTSFRVREIEHSEDVSQVEILDASGHVIYEFTDNEERVHHVMFSPDGQTLAILPYSEVTYSYEKQIRFIGEDAAPPFILDEEIVYFSIFWGPSQLVFSEDSELVEVKSDVCAEVCG